jgi:hypothetical protein
VLRLVRGPLRRAGSGGRGWPAPAGLRGESGPVYSGPSIITYPGYFEALAWPRFYPYVESHYSWYSEPAYYPYAHYGHYHRPIGPRYK